MRPIWERLSFLLESPETSVRLTHDEVGTLRAAFQYALEQGFKPIFLAQPGGTDRLDKKLSLAFAGPIGESPFGGGGAEDGETGEGERGEVERPC